MLITHVFFDRLGVYKDVVQVDYYEDVEILSQDVVDERLERCWGIGKTKRHYQILEVSKSSPECGLPFLAFLYPDAIVGSGYVKFSEPFGSLQAVLHF